MKREILLLMVLALFIPRVFASRGVESVIDALSGATDFHAAATVTVQLPQGGDDVVYNLEIWSTPAENDPLNPCNYLIDWNLKSYGGDSKGFTAYHAGNFYRNTDERLQECHFQWDSIPFMQRHPVQSSSQFTDMLPAMIARELQTMQTDTTWSMRFTPDTICSGTRAAVVRATQRIHGLTARNVLMLFNPESLMPMLIERENNPGSISEQILIEKYDTVDTASPQGMTEEELIQRYPDVFSKFRESNFSLESLRGKYLPAFSLPTLTNRRYTRSKTDGFSAPTLVVFLDPAVATTPDVIRELRNAADTAPRTINVIYTFLSSDREGAGDLVGKPQPGEQVLMSGQSLARNCGVTSTPSIIIVDEDGTVKDIIIGFNKALASSVIQKTSVL